MDCVRSAIKRARACQNFGAHKDPRDNQKIEAVVNFHGFVALLTIFGGIWDWNYLEESERFEYYFVIKYTIEWIVFYLG